MIFDNLGLPKDTGASDLQDSSRLAGVMMTFNWPRFVDLRQYVIAVGKYVRHPREIKYTFSRDQTICLFAGLKAAGLQSLVDPNYKTEGDIVNPAVRGHFKRCAGIKSNWFEDMCLWLEVYWHVYIKKAKDDETNQLLCMLMCTDTKYLKYYVKNKPTWRENIIDYWCGWRGEPDLAKYMIDTIIKTVHLAPTNASLP